MEPLFRIASTLKQKAVLWFVNRSMEPQIYALDELFTAEEAACLEKLLRKRREECRIEQVSRSGGTKEPASWNLLGRLIELEQGESDQLAFRVVGCLEV
jgi:hypothetical protein